VSSPALPHPTTVIEPGAPSGTSLTWPCSSAELSTVQKTGPASRLPPVTASVASASP
jgi:hypothetical protein